MRPFWEEGVVGERGGEGFVLEDGREGMVVMGISLRTETGLGTGIRSGIRSGFEMKWLVIENDSECLAVRNNGFDFL